MMPRPSLQYALAVPEAELELEQRRKHAREFFALKPRGLGASTPLGFPFEWYQTAMEYTCNACDGSGWRLQGRLTSCSWCSGTGRRRAP